MHTIIDTIIFFLLSMHFFTFPTTGIKTDLTHAPVQQNTGRVLNNTSDSLLVYYSFSGTAADSSGNGFDGTVNGATLTTDRFNRTDRAYYFDGVDDHITIPQNESLEPSFPFAISIWVKQDVDSDLYDRAILTTDYVENASYNGAFLSIDDMQIQALYGDGCCGFGPEARKSVKYTSSGLKGEWQHICANYISPDRIHLYVNLILADTTIIGSATDGINYTINPGSIGRWDNSGSMVEIDYFKGKIDDFRFYNKELSITDIEELYFEDCPEVQQLTGLSINVDTMISALQTITLENSDFSAPGMITLQTEVTELLPSLEFQLGSSLNVITQKGCTFQ